MSTIYYSRIEIDFSNETHKNNFKNLTNTEIGKN